MPDHGSGSGTPVPPSPPVAVASKVLCAGKYADAWEYAAFMCVSNMIVGKDNSGGVGNLLLLDTYKDFVKLGLKANVGMQIFNLTSGAMGEITLVSRNEVTANGVTWSNGDLYRMVPLDGAEIATIDHYLEVTSNDIHAAVAANGACSCTPAPWAIKLLAKINIIEVAAFHHCACTSPSDLTEETKARYVEWAETQLEKIRTGEIELCSGAVGSGFPAVGWAEQSITEWNAANIVVNDSNRNS